MTTIALVRHGETDWNSRGLIQGLTDVPLNKKGNSQALEAAKSLQESHPHQQWSAVVSSPLVRASATARVIAQELEIPLLEPILEFGERDFGSMEGVELARARELYPTGEYPDSEHNDVVFERSLAALDTLRSKDSSGRIVVVTHGGLLHTLLSRLYGARLPSIDNAAVNVVEHNGERWLVRLVNGKAYAT